MEYSNDGVTGYNCDAEDAEAFAQCIKKMKNAWAGECGNPGTYMGFVRNAYLKSLEFDKERSGKCMKEIYKKTMQKQESSDHYQRF